MATVARLMTRSPVCLSEEDDLTRVVEVLAEGGFRHVPVVDDERLVGIVSQTDVLGWLGSSLRRTPADSSPHALQRFVAGVMVRDPIHVAPGTRVADAALTMLREGVGSLPVVSDEGRVVGIVTQTDLLRYALQLELTDEQGRSHSPLAPHDE